MTGKLIVLDGTDGSGKTVQTQRLVDRLRSDGRIVSMIDFPQYGTPSAALVEQYLNGKFGSATDVGPYRASIFFACDRYAASFSMREKLAAGEILVSNRYVSANMGHQAGKIKDTVERERFLSWLEGLEFNIFGIPKPDLNILLYMPPEVGQKLVDKKAARDYIAGKKRDIHEADLQHLKDAAEAFGYCARKYNWTVIDCSAGGEPRPIEEIGEDVWAAVQGVIGTPKE